jgi:transcriptional regulator GlxA family with amidase domain
VKSGFVSARAMRRAFLAHIGVTPSDYRERFQTSGDGARPPLADPG